MGLLPSDARMAEWPFPEVVVGHMDWGSTLACEVEGRGLQHFLISLL